MGSNNKRIEQALILYAELAQTNQDDFYSLFQNYKCCLEKYSPVPLGYGFSFSPDKEMIRYLREVDVIDFACHLAISKDSESLIGANYLQSKFEEMRKCPSEFARDLGTRTLIFLAIAKNDMALWEQAKVRDKRVFDEHVARILKDRRFRESPFMKQLQIECEVTYSCDSLKLLSDDLSEKITRPFPFKTLPKKCEATITCHRTYILAGDESLKIAAQKGYAPLTSLLRNPEKVEKIQLNYGSDLRSDAVLVPNSYPALTSLMAGDNKEEQYQPIYPALESTSDERNNAASLFTNFDKTLQLIVNGSDKKDEKKSVKEAVEEAVQKPADKVNDLIVFDTVSPSSTTALKLPVML